MLTMEVETELEINDLVEVTDYDHALYGLFGTVSSLIGKYMCMVRITWRAIEVDNIHDDKRCFDKSQLTKRGHAEWRD